MLHQFTRAGLLAWLVFAPSPPMATEPADCELHSADELVKEVERGEQFHIGGALLEPMIALWPARASLLRHLRPDEAIVFAWPTQPLLVTLVHDGCLIGAYQIDREQLWQALLTHVGPAV